MTPQMDSAMAARRVMIVGLIKIDLPDHSVCLCDGSISLSWNGDAYTGKDALFGTIDEIEAISEEAGDIAPGIDIAFLPPSAAAAVDLCNPAMQGAPVRGWLAVVDHDTGEVIPDPELLFAGEVDVPILEIDPPKRRVQMQLVSVFERLMMSDEGVRLADSFHQYVWPGEFGLSQMTGTSITRLWGPGEKPPAATQVPSAPMGGGDYYTEPTF